MLTDEQLDKFKTDHGRIAHLIGKGGGWEVVLRKPNRAEWRKFKADAANPSTASVAQENLCRVLAVHPPKGDAFEALLNEWPAIPEAFAGALHDLIGMSVEETGK